MEKVLLVINAHKPGDASMDFACKMATLARTKLTGLFIENLYYESTPVSAVEGPFYFKTVKEADAAVTADTEQAVRLFREKCRAENVVPEVYIDKGEPIQEVIFESRFADLLILDPEMSFYGREEQLPSHFVKEILVNAECPVLLAPQKFDAIEEIVFCYDGSASSVFAIRQFAHLFPGLSSQKVLLLEVNKTGAEEFTESHRRMMEWLRAHYQSAYYHALQGGAKDELQAYLFMKTKKMIVMGAYGRNMLSNFFRKSNADVLMRMVDLPIFITHH